MNLQKVTNFIQDSQSLGEATSMKMVTYITEALTAMLVSVPLIVGRPTFKRVWDTEMALLKKVHKIKHPDHPTEGMEGMMMIPAAFALVSTTVWAVPEEVREFFEIP